MQCTMHPENPALWICENCGADLCNRCLVVHGNRVCCTKCGPVFQAADAHARVRGDPRMRATPPDHLSMEQARQMGQNSQWGRAWNFWFGRHCLGLGIVGLVFYFWVAFLLIGLLSDPTFPDTDFSFSAAVGRAYLGFSYYLLVAGIIGIYLFFATRKQVVIAHRGLALLFIILAPLCIIVSGSLVYLMPVIRGMVAVLPAMGINLLCYSMATSPHSGIDAKDHPHFKRLLIWQMLLPLGLTAAFEACANLGKTAGIACVYPAFIFLGIISFSQGFEAWHLIQKRWATPSEENNISPLEAAIRARLPAAPRKRALTGAVAGSVVFIFILMLSPAVYLLSTPAQLEITQSYYKTGSSGHLTLDVVVVNRGGLSSGGPIELWVSNGTVQKLAATTGKLDGYGSWKVGNSVQWDNISLNRRYLNLTVVQDGKNVDSSRLTPEPTCIILPVILPLGLAGGALSGYCRRRRQATDG